MSDPLPQPPPSYPPVPPPKSGMKPGAKIALGIVIAGCVITGGCFACITTILENSKRNLNAPQPVASESRSANSPRAQPGASSVTVEKTNWRYADSTDEMSGKTYKIAATTSSNTISLGFPYQGEQHGTLRIVRHPRMGNRVTLDVEKGQFLSSVFGGNVTMRFDDGPPRKFSTRGAADGDSTVIFISDYKGFVANTRKAKTLRIEAQFYQSGLQVFVFDVDGLVWQ